jgi:hypothetical protein
LALAAWLLEPGWRFPQVRPLLAAKPLLGPPPRLLDPHLQPLQHRLPLPHPAELLVSPPVSLAVQLLPPV